ncbi:MAG: tetratricopeptide repeat protein [Kangiellaceae bacterium]|nr:tetratricopeptide repeat protein [Kangiellaceae bacterium]
MKKSTAKRLTFTFLGLSLWGIVAAPGLADTEKEIIQQGIEAYHLGNYQKSRQIFSHERFAKAESGVLSHYAGRLAYLDGNFDQAEKLFKQAINKNPHNGAYFYWLAVTYAAQFRTVSFFSASSLADQFLEAAETAIRLEPNSIAAHYGLLQFYTYAPGIVGGSLKKARKRADIIFSLDDAAGNFALASIARYEEDYLSAEEFCRKALAIAPQKVRYHYLLALILSDQNKHAEAAKHFFRTSELEPDGPFERIQIWAALYYAGRTSAESGLFLAQGLSAIKKYSKRPLNHPDLPKQEWAEFRLASIYALQGRKDDAIKQMNQILTREIDRKLRKKIKSNLKKLKRS